MTRKLDEVALYAALRARAIPSGRRQPGVYALGDEAERLGIPYKRAHRLVEKWARRGWWDYGVSVRGGWFTPCSPDALDPRDSP